MLHQHNYTEDLLKEHAAHLPARKRTTPGDAERLKKVPPPPDPSNPEYHKWIKRGQRILGGVLWLSTRTRPDLAYAVSATARVLTKDLELLKVKRRHILQHLNTTKTKGLFYVHPRKKKEVTEFTIFGDSSFAPSGKHSQSGLTIHLSHGNSPHLIHWQSPRELKIAESSAAAELYALASGRKSARNFRLLIHESFTTSIIMSLRCDNTATIAMLEEPGWMTRYVSLYGGSTRNAQRVEDCHLCAI